MYALDSNGNYSKVGPQNCGQELRTYGDTLPLRTCWQISDIQKPHWGSERECMQQGRALKKMWVKLEKLQVG